jgi:hypothetical protein
VEFAMFCDLLRSTIDNTEMKSIGHLLASETKHTITIFVIFYLYLNFFLYVCLFFGVKGEERKKLDVLSNEVFCKALISSGRTVSD